MMLSGIEIDVNSKQPPKAQSHLLFILVGIIVFLLPTINVSVEVSITALQLSRESNIILFSATFIDEMLLHALKAPQQMVLTLPGIWTEIRLEQPLNAPLPMHVIPSGMWMEVIASQPEKVQSFILSTLLGIIIEDSPSQPAKALSPIFVMLSGMLIEVRLKQRQKAPFPISLTPSGM